MRYRVPQNIDMEDKIIGPLTMTQFVFVLVGGMIVYLDFVTLGTSLPLLFWVTAVPIGLITLAFGFGKVQDQPFPKFLASVLLYLTRPKSRIWEKDPASNHLTIVTKNPTTPQEASIPGDTLNRGDVGSLASVLDTTKKQEVRSQESGGQPSTVPDPTKGRTLEVRSDVKGQMSKVNGLENSSPETDAPYRSAPPLAVMSSSTTPSSPPESNVKSQTSNVDPGGLK